jgi:hypothetical protein
MNDVAHKMVNYYFKALEKINNFIFSRKVRKDYITQSTQTLLTGRAGKAQMTEFVVVF